MSINLDKVKSVAEQDKTKGTCTGCLGNEDMMACASLPPCVVGDDTDIIWIDKVENVDE